MVDLRIRREQVLRTLRADADRIKSLGVSGLFLFGSTARDEARPESDIDLFVDYDLGRFGLIELVRLQREIGEALGRPADVTTRDGLHPALRAAIEAEALRVF